MNFANYIICLHLILFSVKSVDQIFYEFSLSSTSRMTLIYLLSKIDYGFISSYWIIFCYLNMFAEFFFKEASKITYVLKKKRYNIPYMYFVKQVGNIKISLWVVNYKKHKTNVYKNDKFFIKSYNFLCLVVSPS